MKNFTCSFLRKTIALAALIFTGGMANAATFTAVASGNFTSAATWGGTAPSTMISGDNIVIPAGITVTLNQDVMVNGGLSTVTVLGNLVSSAGSDLMVTGNAALTGSGNVTVDSLVLGGTAAALGLSGNINARAFTSLGLNIASNAVITASESVTLASGLLDLSSVTVNLSTNGNVILSGGSVNVGSLANMNMTSYNVIYTGTSANAGAELQGSGLNNITINVPSTSTVTLNSDLTANGMLTLSSGTLVLNGYDLALGAASDVSASAGGMISSTAGSDITINSNNSLAGSLHFASTGNTVNNLTVNMGNASSSAGIGSDLNVNGTLSLQSGKLNIGSNKLKIGTSGSVSGGSANSYVTTDAGGRLTMNIGAGGSGTFHIGTSANYAPVMVTLNSGSSSGNISAGVNTGVHSGGTVGTDLATTQPVVNSTWFVSSDASSNVNMNIQPMWPAAMEVNGFDRTQVYVAANTNGTWDVASTTSATANGGMYTTTRNNVTASSGAYAVMDTDVVNGISNIEKTILNIYPNPVVNTINFDLNTVQPMNVTIYDIAGHLVKSATISGTSISVAELPAGSYTARVSNTATIATARFVKQ